LLGIYPLWSVRLVLATVDFSTVLLRFAPSNLSGFFDRFATPAIWFPLNAPSSGLDQPTLQRLLEPLKSLAQAMVLDHVTARRIIELTKRMRDDWGATHGIRSFNTSPGPGRSCVQPALCLGEFV
jgi:hypothetical protein